MAVNKVVVNDKMLIDLTSDTVTPKAMLDGITAHDKSGSVITGKIFAYEEYNDFPKLKLRKSGDTTPVPEGYFKSAIETHSINGNDGILMGLPMLTDLTGADYRVNQYTRVDSEYVVCPIIEVSEFGNATADKVLQGKTFTGAGGFKVEGTIPSTKGIDSTAGDFSFNIIPYDFQGISDGTIPMPPENDNNFMWVDNGDMYILFSSNYLSGILVNNKEYEQGVYMDPITRISMQINKHQLGNATADKVLSGYTYTGSDGINRTGTYVPPTPTDFTQCTVAEETLLSGIKAYNSNGTLITGTYTPPVVPTFSTIYTGTGTPSNSIGADGDLFFNF